MKHLGYSRLSGLQPGRLVVMMSSFSDSIVFAVLTRKTAFSNNIVFKSFDTRERFRSDPFSLIVFGVVVWTVAVSGTKQYWFSLENGVVWTGSHSTQSLKLRSLVFSSFNTYEG